VANFFDTIPADDTQPTDAAPRNFFADILVEQPDNNPPQDLLAPAETPQLSQYNPPGLLSRAATAVREKFSPILGPTQAQLMNDGPERWNGVGLIPEASKPLIPIPRIPQQESRAAQIAAGIGNTALGFGEFLESPLGIATAGASGAGKLAQNVVSKAFAADMASKVPEEARRAGELSVTGTPQQQTEANLGLAAQIAMPAALAAHGISPTKPEAAPAAAKWAKTTLNDAQLKDLVDRGNLANGLESVALDPATGNPISNAKSTLEKADARIAELNAEKERTQNASNEPSPARLPESEVRAQVGPETSLRQQGEATPVSPLSGTPDAPVVEPKPVEAQKVETPVVEDEARRYDRLKAKKEAGTLTDPVEIEQFAKADARQKSLKSGFGDMMAQLKARQAKIDAEKAAAEKSNADVPALEARGYDELRRSKMTPEQKAEALSKPIPTLEEDQVRNAEIQDALEAEKDPAKRQAIYDKFGVELELLKKRNTKNPGFPPERPSAKSNETTNENGNKEQQVGKVQEPETPKTQPELDSGKKEPWQLTQKERIALRKIESDKYGGSFSKTQRDSAIRRHRSEIETAISEGRTIPPEVLKDYPDLRASAKAAEPKNAPETITGSNEGKASEMPAEVGASPTPEQSSPKIGSKISVSGGGKFHQDVSGTVVDVLNDGRIVEVLREGDTHPIRVTLEDYKNQNFEGGQIPKSEKSESVAIPGQTQKAGLTLEEAKKHLEEANASRPLGMTWDQIEAKQGGKLNSRPDQSASKPVEAQPKVDVSDWTSATEDIPESSPIEPPNTINPETGLVEYHAGVPIPKFENRKMSEIDRVTGNRSAKLQKSFAEAKRSQKEINRDIPDRKRQEAASVYREANGDMVLLKEWETNAKQDWMRRMAKDAQTLTPKEIAVVNKVAAAFDILGKRGEKNDVLKSFRENYITHVWDVTKPGQKFGFGSAALKAKFKFSKARSFDTFFDGDQAGFKPKSTAIGDLLPAYMEEMNRTIADRQAVQELVNGKAKDGSPLVVPRGNAKVVENDGGKSVLVAPKALKDVDTSHYKIMENQPALADWTWAGKDTDGNPIFMKSDLAVHPDVYRRLNSILGTSAFKQWYRDATPGISQVPKAILKGIDMAQGAMKREMFGFLAPFHQVQEGTHAVGHKVNPFFGIPKIDFKDPGQIDAARHGLMLLPDKTVGSHYLEGVGSQSSLISQGLRKTGKAGKAVADVIDGYQDYLFHQYIPGLKYKTYEAILDRNTKRYQPELAKGELTPSDIKTLSAEQSNAAYGHLNYAMLDRNPTMQHLAQIALLAPDFLEARARFVGQAVKGLNGKVGREQLAAIATLALAQAGSAFVLSKLSGDDWDPKHPFEVIHNGRRYSMRSVPEDIFSAMKDTRQFIYSRVSPLVVRGGIQLATGLNYRGEKVGAAETLGELLTGYIPIMARAIPGLRELTSTGKNNPVSPLEQLAGSLGVRVSRYSPISETYRLAGDWMDKEGMAKDRGSYPISKYQKLRYSLEDGDLNEAKLAYEELKKEMKPDQITRGFKESVNHPFTGSKTSDAKFAATLKPYEKALYNQALKKRQDIWNNYTRISK